MSKICCLILFSVIVLCTTTNAQPNNAQAYEKFMQLTKMFTAKDPYNCLAIVVVKYDGQKPLGDTSKLIYKNGSTYYKSRIVERLEGSQGQLIVNHQTKSATLELSDSVKLVLQKEMKLQMDKSLEAILDSDFQKKDDEAFKTFIVKYCNAEWTKKDGVEEISFMPKSKNDPVFLSIKIRFNAQNRILYYEYVNSDIYSKDWNGNPRVRYVTTIYDRFNYDHVPDIPVKLSDFLEWTKDWTVNLKKYTNYKFSLL